MLRPKTNAVDLKTRKPVFAKVLITHAVFMEALDIMEKFINDLRPYRRNQKNLDEALKIVTEMRFVSRFSYQFRQETYPQLDELLDDIYVELNDD